MNVQNEMKLSFLSHSVNEAFARTAVTSFFTQLDPTVDELADIKTAVSEAVTNCIVHAYRDTIGPIQIVARVLENNTAYIKVRDRGCGIEDVKKAMEPLFTTAPEEERAGLGFAVMESFMDTLRVFSTPGKGTSVVMKKKLTSRARHG
jgi:stage II sporulation protein AB (anti-sigma F factor)